jgi:hypothetical protein
MPGQSAVAFLKKLQNQAQAESRAYSAGPIELGEQRRADKSSMNFIKRMAKANSQKKHNKEYSFIVHFLNCS